MTVNRASAISVKRELLPVLWVQLKAVVFNVLVPPSFEKRKKAQTSYLLCKALQLASLCTISLQAGKIKILFQLSWHFHRRCTLFMTKFYFWSRPLHADSFSPKAVHGKSSYLHDCYFLWSKAFIGNCNFFHRFSDKYGLNNKILNFKKILCVGSFCRRHP